MEHTVYYYIFEYLLSISNIFQVGNVVISFNDIW